MVQQRGCAVAEPFLLQFAPHEETHLVHVPPPEGRLIAAGSAVQIEGENHELHIDTLFLELRDNVVPAIEEFRRDLHILLRIQHQPLIETVHAKEIVSLPPGRPGKARHNLSKFPVVRRSPDIVGQKAGKSVQADRFSRLFFKFEQSVPADHRPAEPSGGSLDHCGEIQRGSGFDLNLLRVDRLPVLIGDETDRRFRGAPDQLPASAAAAHFDREQVPALPDREKHLVVSGGEGVVAVSLLHGGANHLAVEVRFEKPVRGEPGAHHSRFRSVDLGKDHSRRRTDPPPQSDKVDRVPPARRCIERDLQRNIRFPVRHRPICAGILEKYVPAGTEPKRYRCEFLNGNITDHRFTGSRADLKTEFTALPRLRHPAGREHEGMARFPRRQFDRPGQPEIASGVPTGPVGDEDGAARLPPGGKTDLILF